MQILSMRIDRLGRWTDVVFQRFAPGFNAIHLPHAADRTAVGRFVRSMILGCDDSPQRGAADGASLLTGELVLQTKAGKRIVRGYQPDDARGRFTLEDNESPQQERPWQGDVGKEVNSAFDPWFLLGMGGADVERLLAGVSAKSFAPSSPEVDSEKVRQLERRLFENRRRLAELAARDHAGGDRPDGNTSRADLTRKRSRLLEDSRSSVGVYPATRQPSASRADSLSAEIAEWEGRAEKAKHDLAALDAAALAAERTNRPVPRGVAPVGETEIEQISAELRECDAQIERWQQVGRDMETHAARLQQESQQLAACPQPDPRRYLNLLRNHADTLQQAIVESSREDGCALCQHHRLRSLTEESIPLVREHLQRLGDEFDRWEAGIHETGNDAELSQLHGSRQHLQGALDNLLRRRQRLVADRDALQSGTRRTVHGPHGRHCRCLPDDGSTGFARDSGPALAGNFEAERQRHGEYLPSPPVPLPGRHSPGVAGEGSSERRCAMQAQRQAALAKLEDLRAAQHHLQAGDDDSAGQANPQGRQSALDRLDERIRDAGEREQLLAAIAQLEAELRRLAPSATDSPLVQRASMLLRKVSNGDLQQVSLDRSGKLYVAHRDGRRTAAAQLTPGDHGQVCLSVCLALTESYREHGTRLPLVIDDGLSDAGIGGMERAVDLLADFARGGHQVVLLTSRSELADRLRAMEIMVHELPPPAGKAFEIESVVRIEPDRGVEHALSTSPSSAQPYDHGRPAHAGNGRVAPRPGEDRAPRTLAYHVSSCEEFPGELTDRARSPRGVRATVSQSNEELDAAPGDSSAIEEALAITPDSLELLRKLGLCRVGDLRRADADDAARRLRYTGITASMIRDWQARCRDWSQASRRTSSEPRPQAAKNVHSDHEAARHTPARSANAAPKLAARPEAERAEHSTETVAEGPVILAAGASSSRGGPRFYLDAGNSIADSPSIGPRMGEQLKAIGIHTVADLLKADPHSAAEQLHNRRVVAETIRQWQQQALLASRIPGLRGHDAQILVACGITRPEELAATRAENLWAKVEPFSETVEGKRIIRNGKPPDVEEVRDWIRWAAHARSSRAA